MQTKGFPEKFQIYQLSESTVWHIQFKSKINVTKLSTAASDNYLMGFSFMSQNGTMLRNLSRY